MNRIFLIAGCFILLGITSCKQETKKQQLVPDVPFVLAQQKDQPLYMDFVGEVLGSSDIKIQARVDGLITGIHFLEGRPVKKDQLLYTIDPLPYATKVDKANSELAAAKSQLAKAESDLNRIRPLAEMNAVSQRELDAALATFNAAKAMVSANAAAVENARIELGYCNVTAPIAGVIGLSNVKVGDYVGKFNPNGMLNTISNVEGVRVRFSVSEMDLLRYGKATGEVDSTLVTTKNIDDVRLILSNNSEYTHPGKLKVADRSIDPATGSLTIEALFPNPENQLRPGQFVRVKLQYATRPGALLVPQRAVLEMQGMYNVVVINAENKIQAKPVEVAERTGKMWVVTKGLAPGDRIAVVGNMFIKPGTVVNPVPQPKENPATPN
jgi:membrane fusion protein, multidrug efflux system